LKQVGFKFEVLSRFTGYKVDWAAVEAGTPEVPQSFVDAVKARGAP
jgi:hypothetical protein